MSLYIIAYFKLFFRKFFPKEDSAPLINILTRTSGRPNGFKKCRDSIVKQTYKNVRHIVSYDTPEDLNYIKKFNVDILKVDRLDTPLESADFSNYQFKPYNLYCNDLLNEVKEGWIIFLDDDDMFKDRNVLKVIARTIKRIDEDTLIIGYTQYPNRIRLPSKETFKKREIKLRQIDTACFIFHSKYKHHSEWDCWWAADFRFVKKLSDYIPKQKWIPKVITYKNTLGGLGKRLDLPS